MFFEVPRPASSTGSRSTSPSTSPFSNSKKRKIECKEPIPHFLPRTPTACHRCRVKKSRCLPEENSCKKCKREGAICTFPQVTKLDTKARNGPAYLEMLEVERNMLIQALRQLSKERGDVSSLEPSLRVLVENVQASDKPEDVQPQATLSEPQGMQLQDDEDDSFQQMTAARTQTSALLEAARAAHSESQRTLFQDEMDNFFQHDQSSSSHHEHSTNGPVCGADILSSFYPDLYLPLTLGGSTSEFLDLNMQDYCSDSFGGAVSFPDAVVHEEDFQ